MPIGGLASAGIGAAISLISGIGKSRKARALERQNVRPTETVPQGVLDATAIAKRRATFGLSSTAKLAAERDIQRAATDATASAVDRRGGMETIGAVQQGVTDATTKLAVEDATQQQAKEGQLITQENQLGGWQDKVWDWNSRQKYEENAAAIRALKGSAEEETNTAEDMLLSGGVRAAEGGYLKPSAKTPDPTLSHPDLYGNGLPSDYSSYLANWSKLKNMSGAFQSSF